MKYNTTNEEMTLKDWLSVYPPRDIEGEWNWIDKENKMKITISYINKKYCIDCKYLDDNNEYITKFSYTTNDVNWLDWFVSSNLIYFQQENNKEEEK